MQGIFGPTDLAALEGLKVLAAGRPVSGVAERAKFFIRRKPPGARRALV